MGDSRKKVAPRTETEDDGTWLWISFAPESRLILDFIIGPRKQYVANELIEVTDKHLSDSKPLFVTDGLEFYAEALLKKYDEWVEFPKTGKRGRPRKPAIIPDRDMLRLSKTNREESSEKLKKDLFLVKI